MASSPDNPPAASTPRPGSGPGIEIAPQLESVLRNLNVNLEDELIRYRRQRHGRVPPPPPPRRAAQRHTIDLISVSASSPSEPSTATGSLNQPPPPPPNPFLNQTPEPDTPLEDPVELPAADMEPLLDIGETTTKIEEDELPETAAGTALPIHTTDTSPDGYLESSEELLKSIADEQTAPEDVPEPYSPNKKNNSLLKLAGLVLVILAGIGVGFAVTDPPQLQQLRARLRPADTEAPPRDEATTSESSDPAADSATATPETSTDGYNPPGPDLSTREFVELDLESLSTLELDSSSGSSPLPSTAALPNNPAQSPLPAPAASPTPGSQPAPAASPTNPPATPPTTPSPTTTPETTAASPAAPGAAPAAPAPTGSNFYVVTSYTGDASLNKARTLVPDAFVRNFKTGARIQLAAFDNRAQAEDQVAFLTQQGATVELVGPTNE